MGGVEIIDNNPLPSFIFSRKDREKFLRPIPTPITMMVVGCRKRKERNGGIIMKVEKSPTGKKNVFFLSPNEGIGLSDWRNGKSNPKNKVANGGSWFEDEKNLYRVNITIIKMPKRKK